jgi:dimeric dUTPase (all-alpha-NTP-PPase superfamily)
VNLAKLFETQRELGKVGLFNYRGPDRFEKLILALLVELGECANEQRSWKFWSKDQTPRTKKARYPYMDLEDAQFYNPLLEEYVDGLHFVLELGLEIDVHVPDIDIWNVTESSVVKQFNRVFKFAVTFEDNREFYNYNNLISEYFELGELLGFTWEEIEQAYFEKNQINHERQYVGY